jgi:hypothetical protein
MYVLVALVEKHLGPEQRLYTVLQILSVRLLEETPILQAFSEELCKAKAGDSDNRLMLREL